MSNYEQMKKIERIILCSIIAFVAVFAVAIYSFIALGSARQKEASQATLIDSLNSKKADLEQQVGYAEDNIEELARNKFGMVKDGETVYVYDN